MENNLNKKRLSPTWKKIRILSTILTSIIIPLTAIIIGNNYSTALKQREIQAKYVELAINILNSRTTDNVKTKDWAFRIINEYSDIKIDSLTKDEIIKNEFLSSIGQNKLIDLGIIKAKSGDYDAAIVGYDMAIEQDSTNPAPYALKGYALYSKKEYQTALNVLNKSLAINKDYVWTHYNLGLVLWRLGEKEKAINEEEKVLKTHPELKQYMQKDMDLYDFRAEQRFKDLIK